MKNEAVSNKMKEKEKGKGEVFLLLFLLIYVIYGTLLLIIDF